MTDYRNSKHSVDWARGIPDPAAQWPLAAVVVLALLLGTATVAVSVIVYHW